MIAEWNEISEPLADPSRLRICQISTQVDHY